MLICLLVSKNPKQKVAVENKQNQETSQQPNQFVLTINQSWHNPRLYPIWKLIVVLAEIQNNAEHPIEAMKSLKNTEKHNQQIAAKPNQKRPLFHRVVMWPSDSTAQCVRFFSWIGL